MNSTSLQTLLKVFLVALVASLALTPLMRKVAIKTGQVAVPRKTRWHKKETALLGGIAIYASTMLAWALFGFVLHLEVFGRAMLVIMAASTAIFLLGLVDDLTNMDPQHKLAGQIIVSAIMLFLGFQLQWTGSKTLDLLISILWLVGITNAFNLLDNMDGLAAGIAFIGGMFLLLFLLLYPQALRVDMGVLFVLSAFLGALLGFLVYNFNPASIFMGDAGSLFIGFLLASLTMKVQGKGLQGGGIFHLISVISVPIFIVLIPILDTALVSITRKLFGRHISQGGKDHSSHRLVALGFSERNAVLVLYGFSIVAGSLALIMPKVSPYVGVVILTLYLLVILFFWIYLGKIRVYEEESILSRSEGITPVLVEVTYRRRLLEVLLDLILISLAYYAAYLLRFEGNLRGNFDMFLKSLPVIIAAQIVSSYFFGIYKGIWQSTGIHDLIDYGKAVTSATVLTILVLLGLYRFQGFSRAVFVIYWVLMIVFMSVSRLSFRLLDEGFGKRGSSGKRTLIYGAGMGGQLALKEIEFNRELGLKAIGFIDDDNTLLGRRIRGYPVLGDRARLADIIKEHNVEEIIVSFRENGARVREEVERYCEMSGHEVRVRQMKLTIE